MADINIVSFDIIYPLLNLLGFGIRTTEREVFLEGVTFIIEIQVKVL